MQKTDAWARFWEGGSLTSFGDRFAQGYQGEVRQLWETFLSGLPVGAVVADLGAGNGALEEIAEDHARRHDRSITVHAFDLATVKPRQFASKEETGSCRIVWHVGTPNEATGLENATVDAVIGNFAFEYGDDDATIREIARILKPGGRCRFLMHHAASNIIANAKNEYEIIEAELAKDGFLDSVEEYLRAFGDIRKPAQFEKMKASGKAEPLRKRMNDQHARIVKLARVENGVLLIRQIMSWTAPLVTPPMFFEPRRILLQRLKDIREELAANRSRLNDMQGAAVDDARMQRIAECFEQSGMRVATEVFKVSDEPKPIGWLLDISRA